MKTKIYMGLSFVLFILLVLTLVSADDPPPFAAYVGDWHHVSEAEVNFCAAWGGYESLHSGQNIIEDDLPPVGGFTRTVQGLYSILEDGTRLYEIAWYVHPVGGSIIYQLQIIDENGARTDIPENPSSGEADAVHGSAVYAAFISETIYNFVELQVDVDDGEGTLRVEIVEKG
jgi:hypothetical protein